MLQVFCKVVSSFVLTLKRETERIVDFTSTKFNEIGERIFDEHDKDENKGSIRLSIPLLINIKRLFVWLVNYIH